jgi:hypothetical protein
MRDTTTGATFERYASLENILVKGGYIISKDFKNYTLVHKGSKFIGYLLKGHALYRYIPHYKKYIHRKLLPDNLLLMPDERRVMVFEMKTQSTSGSADEKLQTGRFKLRQYRKLFPDHRVDYTFILDEWFKQDIYIDVREFIVEEGCAYIYHDQIEKFLLDFVGRPPVDKSAKI